MNDERLVRARTFSDLPEGVAFWYENSSGLVEFAVNQGDAKTTLGIDVGSKFSIDSLRPDIAPFSISASLYLKRLFG